MYCHMRMCSYFCLLLMPRACTDSCTRVFTLAYHAHAPAPLLSYLLPHPHPYLSFPTGRMCYLHHFYSFSSSPPFAIRAVSPPFRFPSLFNSSVDAVQFCTGIALHTHDTTKVILSFGVGDCVALSIIVDIETVKSLLGAGRGWE